jgi:hypothetical protein
MRQRNHGLTGAGGIVELYRQRAAQDPGVNSAAR